jgi:hypothetical protein
MRKILTASKDTTLYQTYPTLNTGFDEILEIGKVVDESLEVLGANTFASASARTLISFNLPTTASVFSGSSYFLNLKLANASKLKRNQTITVYAVSQSWDEGSGYLYQQPYNVTDGATWKQLATGVSWSLAGGDFLTGSPSQSITLTSYPLQDLRIDVTHILQPIVSQSLQASFYGLALQFPVADEQDNDNEGNIKIFSTQTHTVHQPTLEIAWDNQTFVTGSLKTPPSLDVKIAPSNLREVYTKGDVDKVNLVVRDQFPLKSFDSILRYNNKYYLPSSSYYSIVDTQSNTTIIPFDEFSKIDTDTAGSYVVLDTSVLYPGRFYTLKLKIELGPYVRVVDTNTLFKVQ